MLAATLRTRSTDILSTLKVMIGFIYRACETIKLYGKILALSMNIQKK